MLNVLLEFFDALGSSGVHTLAYIIPFELGSFARDQDKAVHIPPGPKTNKMLLKKCIIAW